MKLVALTAVLLIATAGVASPALAALAARGAAMDEAEAIQSDYAQESGRKAYAPGHGIRSSLAITYTLRARSQWTSPIVTQA